jgi:hypothetical protein
MPWALCVAILSSLLALHAQAPERSLAIFLKFESAPSAESLQVMKDEVARILKPAGFTLHWRSLEDNAGTESFSEIAVFQFRGTCALPSGRTETDRRDVTLATTAVGSAGVQPFSEVECATVARSIPSAPGNRQKALGRILGRVMIHELFHSLTNATVHSGRGILKSTQSVFDLVLGSPQLDDADTRLLIAQTAH